MSGPVLTIAMLLTGTPGNTDAVELEAPAVISAPTAVSGADAPVAAAEPAQSAAPAESPSLASVPAPAADPMDPNAIVVTGRPSVPGDPLHSVNEVSFEAVQTVDKAVVGPVSLTYKRAVPGPVRSGLRNFLNNLQEPVVFLNYLLQIKPGKAVETLGRFTVNSTIGAAGLLDVAKKRPFNLPRRPNGFAYTLGYYGVKPGAYMYLPLIGPTTVRDLFGRWGDLLVLPFAVGTPFNQPIYSVSTVTVRSMDERAEAEEQLVKLREEKADLYAAIRENYLQNRQAEIDALHGRPSSAVDPTAELTRPAAVAPADAPLLPPLSGQAPAAR